MAVPAGTAAVNFDPSSAARIAKVVKQAERQSPGPGGDRGNGPPPRVLYAQLTSEDPNNPGNYAWKLQVTTAGQVVNDTSGTGGGAAIADTAFTAADINGAKGLGQVNVVLHFAGYDGQDRRRWLFVGPGNGLAYGKLVAAWTPGSATVTLTPSSAGGNVSSPAPANVTINVYGNGKPPAMLDAAAGDVLPYFATGSSGNASGGANVSSATGVLLSPPILTIPSGSQYEVLMLGGNVGPARWDDVRVAP